MSDSSPTTPVRKHAETPDATDREAPILAVAVPLALSVVAWAYLLWDPPVGVARGVLSPGYATDPAILVGELALMDVRGWATSLPWFALTWAIVIVAMLFPVVASDVIEVDRWRLRQGRSVLTSAAFVVGYLLAWAVVGVFVFAAIVTLDLQINTASTGLRVGAAILLAVGVYQLTQTKAATLNRARSPLALLDDHGDEIMRHGIRGALQVGIWHGGWALGCWAGLMAVLVALGVVNVGWMAVVTAAMLAEKLAPASWAVPRAVGGLLLLAGVATLITA